MPISKQVVDGAVDWPLLKSHSSEKSSYTMFAEGLLLYNPAIDKFLLVESEYDTTTVSAGLPLNLHLSWRVTQGVLHLMN